MYNRNKFQILSVYTCTCIIKDNFNRVNVTVEVIFFYILKSICIYAKILKFELIYFTMIRKQVIATYINLAQCIICEAGNYGMQRKSM